VEVAWGIKVVGEAVEEVVGKVLDHDDDSEDVEDVEEKEEEEEEGKKWGIKVIRGGHHRGERGSLGGH
jgi:hypothetical protein